MTTRYGSSILIQRSPSLTPPPPSPPRRRTRESNKNFAPYTAYKKVYGDKELRLLEEQENRRRFHKKHPEEPEEDDPAWTASQSQLEEESQGVPAFSLQRQRIPSINAQSSRKKLPPIPTPNWDGPSKYVGRPLIHRSNNAAPLESLSPTASRRYLVDDLSPTRLSSKNKLIDKKLPQNINGRTSIIAHQDGAGPSPRASPAAVEEALRRLYGNDSDDDDGSLRNVHATSNIVDPADDEHREATGPGTSDSAMESVNNTEEDSDGSGSQDRAVSGEEEAMEESEDGLDRKRQRILSRVWPAVLIQKKAEEAK